MNTEYAVGIGSRYSNRFLHEANLDRGDVEEGGVHCMAFGALCMQGWRIRQEDARSCIPDFVEGMSLFAVYDGHGGPEISHFLKLNLPGFLKHHLNLGLEVETALRLIFLEIDAALLTPMGLMATHNIISNLQEGLSVAAENSAQAQGVDYREAAVDVPQNIDEPSTSNGLNNNLPQTTQNAATQTDSENVASEELLPYESALLDGVVDIELVLQQSEWYMSQYMNSRHSYFENTQGLGHSGGPVFKSGSTATVVILKPRADSRLVDLWVANVGDSTCVVSRNGVARNLSIDHKPTDEIEQQRIVAAGGSVCSRARVLGGLNMSRAIGDHQYKRNNKVPPASQMVCAVPDVRHYEVDPLLDEFIVIASDGIWNTMPSQCVVDFIREARGDNYTLAQMCERLCLTCTSPWRKPMNNNGDGLDNTSVIIIAFGEFSPFAPQSVDSATPPNAVSVSVPTTPSPDRRTRKNTL